MSRRQNKPAEPTQLGHRIADTYTGMSLTGLLSRFGTVGIVATLSYLALSMVFVYIVGFGAVMSSVIAYAVCIAISYMGQSRFTFRKPDDTPSQITRFIMMSVAGMLLSYLVPALVTERWEFPALVGFLVIAVVVPILSFVVMKIWVFR